MWTDYYLQTKNKPPSTLLTLALGFVNKSGIALDLGSGSLYDSKFLLSMRFKKVLAVDRNSLPKEITAEMPADKFKFILSSFDEFKFPLRRFDLINAQYSLPFTPRETFNEVWNGLRRSLKVNGVFTGQFFGIKDEWNAAERNMTFHTEAEVKEMLKGMEILEFKEEDSVGELANGNIKKWHVFNIIARKRDNDEEDAVEDAIPEECYDALVF